MEMAFNCEPVVQKSIGQRPRRCNRMQMVETIKSSKVDRPWTLPTNENSSWKNAVKTWRATERADELAQHFRCENGPDYRKWSADCATQLESDVQIPFRERTKPDLSRKQHALFGISFWECLTARHRPYSAFGLSNESKSGKRSRRINHEIWSIAIRRTSHRYPNATKKAKHRSRKGKEGKWRIQSKKWKRTFSCVQIELIGKRARRLINWRTTRSSDWIVCVDMLRLTYERDLFDK